MFKNISTRIIFAIFSVTVVAAALFVVVPLIPDVGETVGPTLSAPGANAFNFDPFPPSVILSATPNAIQAGGSATLLWSVLSADTCTASGAWSGSKSTQGGTMTVSPTQTSTYTLTCTGAGGTDTESVTIEVSAAPVTPTCTINANPTTINAGGSSTITWTTSNATSVSINQNIGTVSANGSRVVSPTTPTTYTLTAIGPNGNATCSTLVTVVPVVAACSFSATKSPIVSGESVTLNWQTSDTARVTIDNGVGEVALSGSKVVSPTVTTTYTLTAYDSAGNVVCVCTVTIVVTTPPPAPVCTLSASPTSITNGGSSTLTWTTSNATSVSINQNIGTVSANGSRVVSPTTSTTYTLTATSASGVAVNCSTTVTVTNTPPPAPVCTLSASPTSITRGGSSTLNWTTTNVSSASINQNIGTITPNGSRSVSPTTTTTYTLTATGNNGSVITCVTTITVEIPENPVRCDAFSASPSTLTSAGTTTLQWVTTNATAVSINNGVGTVSATGTRAVSVSTTTTYTLTAQGVNGPVSCQTTVTVAPVTIVPTCDAFTVSPTSVTRGRTATLNWSTTNATAVSINNGVGSVPVDGSRGVTVDSNTTYTLTATNGSASDTCQTSVTVSSSGGGGGGGSSSPRCTLTASKKTIQPGEAVTLTWKNTRTNDILLKDSAGKTIADSKKDSSIDEDADSIVVRPTQSTSYTLKVIRSSRTRECTVDINVVSPVTVSSVRSQAPLVAGISLATVPYTGFDAGPFMTFLFYALLLVWGLGVAYMLVIKRGPVLGLSLNEATRFANRPVIREHLTQTAPAPDSAVVREQIFGSAFVPPTRATHTPLMASPTSVVGYGSLYEGTHPAETVTTSMSAPVTEVVAPAYEAVTQPVANYETVTARDDAADIAFLEARATDKQVLISSDALHFILAQSPLAAERVEVLDMIIDVAKATYPAEDGWIVVNKARILSLLK